MKPARGADVVAKDLNELKYWLALWRAPGLGPAGFSALVEAFGSPRTVLEAAPGTLRGEPGLSTELLNYLTAPDWAGVDRDLAWAEQAENHIVTLEDPRYPPLLREIPRPPPLLYVCGRAELLARPQLAIVGSRNPTRPGADTAREFARHLAATGLVITSGLALGIDAAAHQGAMEQGVTVAVAGTGLDRVYPARHRELAHALVERGALVSEFPVGTPPIPANFPRRNRLISGMALGTLVVEAAPRSGSLITARLAAEQGREVFAIPGSIHNPLARGCHALIRQGAKLVETAQDVLEELGPLGIGGAAAAASPSGDETAPQTLSEHEDKILNCMGFDPSSVDELVVGSGLTAQQVSSILVSMELRGLVASAAGGRYCRACEGDTR
ncbi:DNA-protecting protein DprA [Ectothiorhodospiraceae bacterium 2226]|nr:DNA-protecting protein DprA [Ectothiorhodospiraceae bacterium 2226]